MGVLLRVTGLSGGLWVEYKVSIFQAVSSKEMAEWVVVAVVGVVVEGNNLLVCPTLKIVVSGFGTGPLPPFFSLFLRGAFAFVVLCEREEDDSDCVVMDWKEDFCLERRLNEV